MFTRCLATSLILAMCIALSCASSPRACGLSAAARGERSHIMAARGSGEHALRHLLAPFARGRHPLEGRLQARAAAARLCPPATGCCCACLACARRASQDAALRAVAGAAGIP